MIQSLRKFLLSAPTSLRESLLSMWIFRKSKARDRDKANWLENNNIDLIILSYSGTEDEWKQSIINR